MGSKYIYCDIKLLYFNSLWCQHMVTYLLRGHVRHLYTLNIWLFSCQILLYYSKDKYNEFFLRSCQFQTLLCVSADSQSTRTLVTPLETDEGKWSHVYLSLSVCFPASLAPPSALTRPKPYQGVRVRDPVKELLRRKRSLELHSAKTAPPTVVRTPWYATLTCMLDDITFFLQ